MEKSKELSNLNITKLNTSFNLDFIKDAEISKKKFSLDEKDLELKRKETLNQIVSIINTFRNDFFRSTQAAILLPPTIKFNSPIDSRFFEEPDPIDTNKHKELPLENPSNIKVQTIITFNEDFFNTKDIKINEIHDLDIKNKHASNNLKYEQTEAKDMTSIVSRVFNNKYFEFPMFKDSKTFEEINKYVLTAAKGEDKVTLDGLIADAFKWVNEKLNISEAKWNYGMGRDPLVQLIDQPPPTNGVKSSDNNLLDFGDFEEHTALTAMDYAEAGFWWSTLTENSSLFPQETEIKSLSMDFLTEYVDDYKGIQLSTDIDAIKAARENRRTNPENYTYFGQIQNSTKDTIDDIQTEADTELTTAKKFAKNDFKPAGMLDLLEYIRSDLSILPPGFPDVVEIPITQPSLPPLNPLKDEIVSYQEVMKILNEQALSPNLIPQLVDTRFSAVQAILNSDSDWMDNNFSAYFIESMPEGDVVSEDVLYSPILLRAESFNVPKRERKTSIINWQKQKIEKPINSIERGSSVLALTFAVDKNMNFIKTIEKQSGFYSPISSIVAFNSFFKRLFNNIDLYLRTNLIKSSASTYLDYKDNLEQGYLIQVFERLRFVGWDSNITFNHSGGTSELQATALFTFRRNFLLTDLTH